MIRRNFLKTLLAPAPLVFVPKLIQGVNWGIVRPDVVLTSDTYTWPMFINAPLVKVLEKWTKDRVFTYSEDGKLISSRINPMGELPFTPIDHKDIDFLEINW